mmetsp:Transcript_76385/g.181677  ORF Transcript_76385/g.181677 Transcript_76385/m.181677 type:complete len:293 (+) Transcript_76385:63-941(+)
MGAKGTKASPTRRLSTDDAKQSRIDSAWTSGVVSPLLVAADAGDTAGVRKLAAQGADVNAAHPANAVHGLPGMGSFSAQEVGHPAFNAGVTALMCASRSGHLAVVIALLEECSADVALQDAECWNALHYACFSGHAEIAKLLVQYGCPQDLITKFERQRPIGFARHRRFAATCMACGDTEPPEPLTDEERAAVIQKSIGKLERAAGSQEPVLHRYILEGCDIEALLSCLRDGARNDVWTPAQDIVLGRKVAIRWCGDHVRHVQEAQQRREAGEEVLRASSVSALQHFIVLPC